MQKLSPEQYAETVLALIKNTYNTQKGKSFINHLITAFMDKEGVSKTEDAQTAKCAITGVKFKHEPLHQSLYSSKHLSDVAYQQLQKFVTQEVAAENESIKKMLKFIERKNKAPKQPQNSLLHNAKFVSKSK